MQQNPYYTKGYSIGDASYKKEKHAVYTAASLEWESVGIAVGVTSPVYNAIAEYAILYDLMHLNAKVKTAHVAKYASKLQNNLEAKNPIQSSLSDYLGSFNIRWDPIHFRLLLSRAMPDFFPYSQCYLFQYPFFCIELHENSGS